MDEEKRRLENALRTELAAVSRLRAANLPDAEKAARLGLRAWQAQRLARTYGDLLESDRYCEAARFFLADLYSPKDCSKRDAELARVIPVLVRMLPAPALETLVDAVRMDALSESLDADMIACLRGRGAPGSLDDAVYAEAYRRCGRQADRAAQIALTREIGLALDRLTRMPLLAASLRLMKKPADMAGLGALHAFLFRGFHAFRRMRGAGEFLARITDTETAIMNRLFAGAADLTG